MKTTLCFTLTLLIFVTLAFVPNGFAQDDSAEYIVRVIYFFPKDREPDPDIDTKLDTLIKDVQQFYADQMERYGFGRKTFRLETDASKNVVVHHVTGKFADSHYTNDINAQNMGTLAAKVDSEINERFDASTNIYLVIVDTSWTGGGIAFVSDSGGSAFVFGSFFSFPGSLRSTAAHELGHLFGLGHDFRSPTYIMSYGRSGTPTEQLSQCAAESLNVNRYFNEVQLNHFDTPTTIQMLPPVASPPNAIRLRFEITDADGLHQAQLSAPFGDSGFGDFGTSLIDCKRLNGNNNTVEFVTTELANAGPYSDVYLRVIDVRGNITWKAFQIETAPLLPTTKVSIPDVKLAAAVRETLNLDPGHDITQVDMLRLKYLKADAHGIINLTGVEQAVNLRLLFFQWNQINDITPLTGLTNLIDLTIGGNINNITPLIGLTNLNMLDLGQNQISDITPLKKLTNLGRLYIGSNQISDITPLLGLTQLIELELSYNPINDITPLTQLINLRLLRLHRLKVSDIMPFAQLINLRTLDLLNNKISDITPLPQLINLQDLNLSRNQIRDLTPLTGMTNLKYLHLQDNQIMDVSPLVGLANLEGLYLAGNPIEDLSPLRRLLANNPNLKIDIDIPFGFSTDFIPDQTFIVGTDVSLTLPIAAGGTAPYTYTLSPIPAGLQFDKDTRVLSDTPTTVGTTNAIYTATDATGASDTLTFTITVTDLAAPIPPDPAPLDVNGDGQVTVIDLAIVALFYGTQVSAGVDLPADVNDDGTVDILDLTAVAQAIEVSAGNSSAFSADDVAAVLEAIADIEAIAEAPATLRFNTSQHTLLSGIAYRNVADALADAKHLATEDVRLGKWMPILKELLHLLREMREIPETTALLPNYPNPFNPETWIPYQLAKSAEVTLTIYAVNGQVVRTLSLGHHPAGVYQSRRRAAYWDGRNQLGEPVASGVYFYTLTAGDFTATRKLLVRK